MAQMNMERLSQAFQNFASASKSLESCYQQLQERIVYLTGELEIRNRQLNEALADAEHNKDYLKAILYNLEEAIIAVDPEGMITTVNRSAEELLGISHADVLGTAFASLPCSLTETPGGAMLKTKGKQYPVIVSRSDVVDAEGCLRGRVILIKDMTRLRELELLHERNQRLIAMGEMAARLVHEIRNPLCSIELYSSMLEQDLVTPEHRELAQGIKSGIGNMNAILTDMLGFARPNKPALSTVRLDRVIGETARLLHALLECRHVTLSLSVSPCELTGDAELLKQVFLNVLINAVQAMPGGGRIQVVLERTPGTAAVRITDTGAGIAPEHLERIFDPFFTTKDEGTGLGLAIVNTIMQANGGYVKVSSRPGEGSCFSLYFPLPTESGCQADRESSDARQPSNISV